MNVVIWIVAGVLAAAFLTAGILKSTRPKKTLQPSMPWVEDFGQGTVRLIGTLEILAAIGLILPPLLDIAPVLAPLAATGLVVMMLLAAATHARRKEPQAIAVNVVLLALAAFVAVTRFGPYSF